MMRKQPKGLSIEDGIEFAEAVQEAAKRGYTVWHLTEQWNSTWYCRLADPNSNAPNMGDSFSYGRQGDTPGKAIRAVLAQFGATPDEKNAENLSKAINEVDVIRLRAAVNLPPGIVKDLFDALAENADARRMTT